MQEEFRESSPSQEYRTRHSAAVPLRKSRRGPRSAAAARPPAQPAAVPSSAAGRRPPALIPNGRARGGGAAAGQHGLTVDKQRYDRDAPKASEGKAVPSESARQGARFPAPDTSAIRLHLDTFPQCVCQWWTLASMSDSMPELPLTERRDCPAVHSSSVCVAIACRYVRCQRMRRG